METKPYSLQSPEEIAKEYGGNKQKIARATQVGLLDPIAAVMAGMFIDRMRSAQTEEQAPARTVAQDILAPQPMPQQMGGQMPPQPTPQQMGGQMGGQMGEQMPPQPMPQQAQQSAGLEGLPVPDQMFDPASMASGGLVAFNEGGMANYVDQYKELLGGIPEGGMANYVDQYKELLGGIPEGKGTEAYKQYLESMPAQLEKQREQDKYMALAQLGASMAGSDSPYFLQSFGQAGAATLPFMQKSAAERRTREAEATKGLAGLDQMQRGESLKAVEGGVGLYTKAMDRNAKLTAAGMAAGKKTDLEKYADAFAIANDPNASQEDRDRAAALVNGVNQYKKLTMTPPKVSAVERLAELKIIVTDPNASPEERAEAKRKAAALSEAITTGKTDSSITDMLAQDRVNRTKIDFNEKVQEAVNAAIGFGGPQRPAFLAARKKGPEAEKAFTDNLTTQIRERLSPKQSATGAPPQSEPGPTNQNPVITPDGKTYYFPTPEQANEFKKKLNTTQ